MPDPKKSSTSLNDPQWVPLERIRPYDAKHPGPALMRPGKDEEFLARYPTLMHALSDVIPFPTMGTTPMGSLLVAALQGLHKAIRSRTAR